MSEDKKALPALDLEHGDKDLIDNNILGAMVLDSIGENYPGIKQFFNTLKLLEISEKEAIFVVSDEMTAEWINNHYMHILEKVFFEESEEHIGTKKLVVKAQEESQLKTTTIKKSRVKQEDGPINVKIGTLNGKQRFSTFVKGASNTLAAIAAERVAEKPGQTYNPLFVYGRTGLGRLTY